MNYLDSNVFIYAAVNNSAKGETSRNIIKNIRLGELEATTSSLTFDEVFWKVKKERGFENALIAGKAFLELPNLILIDVTAPIIWQAYELIKEYHLDPRDAIHAACALSKNIKTIISDDPDFDWVKKFERKEIGSF